AALAGMENQVKGVLAALQPPFFQEIELKQSLGKACELKPGESLKGEFEGPTAVHLLNVRLAHAFKEREAWRGLVVVGTFDGAAQPQIWCPAGDFFGSAPGFNPYAALPFTVAKVDTTPNAQAMQSRWRMPFEKSAIFEL